MKCHQATCLGTLVRVGNFYFCGECGERLTPNDYARLEAQHDAGVSAPDRTIVDTFPYPIARVYADLDDATASWQTRHTALYFTIYQLMRTVGLALVGQYLYRDVSEDDPPEAQRKFNQAIVGLRCPTFSDWITLLDTAARWQGPLRLDLFEGIRGEVTGFKSAVQFLQARKTPPPQFRSVGDLADVQVLRAFQGLRNGSAHAGMLTDKACCAAWEVYRPWVDEILHSFRFLASCRMLASEQADIETGSGVVLLRGSDTPQRISEPLDASVMQALELSPVVLDVPGCAVQPLFPFFHAHLPGDSLHGYDGHNFRNDPKGPRRLIYYLGCGLRHIHENTDGSAPGGVDASERLRFLLEKRQVQWEFRREEVTPWKLQDAVNDYAMRTLEDLQGTKYLPNCYLDRAEVSGPLRSFLLESPVDGSYPYRGFLLLGCSGSGKTAMLAHLAAELLAQRGEDDSAHLVFFIRGDGLDDGGGAADPLFANLVHKIGLKAKDFPRFRELIQHLDKARRQDRMLDAQGRPARRFFIFIDAINEAPRAPEMLQESLKWLEFLRPYGWIRLVLTVRTEAMPILLGNREAQEVNPFYATRTLFVPPPEDFDRPRRPEDPPGWDIPLLCEVEAATVYRRYQEVSLEDTSVSACRTSWEDIPVVTRHELLCNPLYLHFWMWTFRDRTAEPVAGPGELFATYLDDTVSRRGTPLRDAVRILVQHWLAAGTCDLGDDGANAIYDDWQCEIGKRNWRQTISPLELLTCEGLLKKRVGLEGGGYRVPFQQLREYMLFSYMLDEDPGLSLKTARRWASKSLQHDLFPDYAGAFGFLVRRWAEQGRSRDMAGLLETSGLPPAICGTAVDGLVRWVLSANEVERAQRLGFLLKILDVPSRGSWQSAGLATLFLWEVVPRLADWSRRAEMVKFLQAITKSLTAATRRTPQNANYAYDLAVSYSKLGGFHDSAGDAPRAQSCFEHSLSILKVLHRELPTNAQYAINLAATYAGVADFYRVHGDLARALDCAVSGLAIAEVLHHAAPDNAEYADKYSDSLEVLANLHTSAGDDTGARDCYRRAVATKETLYRQAPDRADFALHLSRLYLQLGLQWSDEDSGEARKYFERAVSILEKLRREVPDNCDCLEYLSHAYQGLFDVCEPETDIGRARDFGERALEIADGLYRKVPDSVTYAYELSLSCSKLGGLYAAEGETSRALACFLRAGTIAEELRSKVPDRTDYACHLSSVLDSMGDLHRATGETARAKDDYERSLRIAEDLHRNEPGDVDHAHNLSVSYEKLGDLHKSLGEEERARVYYEQTLAISDELHRMVPDSAEYGRDLFALCAKMGNFYRRNGLATDARECYERALLIAKELHGRAPGQSYYAHMVWATYNKLGDFHFADDGASMARECYEGGLAIVEELNRKMPQCVDYARYLMLSCEKLGDLDLSLGRMARARDSFERALSIASELHHGETPGTADCLNRLFASYNKLGDHFRAEQESETAQYCYDRALSISSMATR